MNDEQLNMPRSSRADETAEDIFARIQRRRALAMNGNNTERGALRHEAASSEAHPTAVAGESLADILRRAAAKEASAPHDAGSAHGPGHEQTGAAGHGNTPRSPEGSAGAGSTGSTGSTNNSAFSNFRGKTASGPRTRPPVDYPLLVDEDGTPIDEDAPDFRDDGRPRDSFPRSKTMQALLRYPTLTTAVGLAVAVPMATLVLRTPAARQTLLRIGKFAAEQEVWKYVRKLSK
jgi:hypothetical protein